MEMPRPLQTVACLHQPDPPSNKSTSSASLARVQGAAVVVFFQQNPPPLEEKTCFNGRLCLYMIRSNRQREPGTTKAPWIYWQPRRTLFVLCSLSEAPFSALFARYRSAKVDGAPSCWFVSSYRFFFFTLIDFQQRPRIDQMLNWLLLFFSTVLFCLHTGRYTAF